MPFKSKAQQRYLESDASPLTTSQKQEWASATDFSRLPNKVSTKKSGTGMVRKAVGMMQRKRG